MMQNITALKETIHPEFEPGVINHEMIQNAYKTAFIGERGRLRSREEIDYQIVDTIRLDFKNILRIDHLWVLPNLTKLSLNFNKLEQIENLEMLTNLKELDLSFNFIEKIERLETLTKLETLSLFHNLITKIENLDALRNMVILSIGDNKIGTLKGIERFRFYKKLQVLNLEGNPISSDPKKPFKQYIAAILPDLKFYKYSLISDAERAEAIKIYRKEVQAVVAGEADELAIIAKRDKELADEEYLSACFVEGLNGYQMYNQIWRNDNDGNALRKIGDEAEEMIEQYKDDFYGFTQTVYKVGLRRFVDRKQDVEAFEKSLEMGRKKSEERGRKLVEDFVLFKAKSFAEAKVHYRKIEQIRQMGVDPGSPEIMQIKDNVDQVHDDLLDNMDNLYNDLMAEEIFLYESVEEVINLFERNITEMLGALVEEIQTNFVQLRDVIQGFVDKLGESAQEFIAIKLAEGARDQVPKELHDCLDDKDALFNIIAGMRDAHLQAIDVREEILVRRSSAWLENLLDGKKKEEMERNRYKIVEVNYFLDSIREAFDRLHNETFEEMQAEQ